MGRRDFRPTGHIHAERDDGVVQITLRNQSKSPGLGCFDL